MYHNRVRKRKGKKRGKVCAVLLPATVAVVIFLGQREQLFRRGWEEVVCHSCEWVQHFFVPVLAYREQPLPKTVYESVESFLFPAADVQAGLVEYETDVQSSLSYEMILALEARDENYIDENGQVVIQNGDGEEYAQDSGVTEGQNTGGDGENMENQEEMASGSENGNGEAGEEHTYLQEPQPQNQDTKQDADAVQPVTATQKVVEYSMDKLSDFDYLVQNFYQIDSTTTIKSDQLNVQALMGKDMRIAHDASSPQILIYHTHSQEGYADSIPGDQATSVVGVGDYLTQILTEQYGYNVIHDRGEYDTVRDKAYSRAAPALEKLLADNPQIDVVIDLHRDGVAETTRLVTNVNGTDMAKVMFFNGLSRTTALGDISYLYNPYIADNLAFSFQMQLTAAEYYPGYTRKVYLKGYRFNMHYKPKSLLVEVGAQTNTVQEAMNAMVPLADVLNKVLSPGSVP